MWVSFLLYFSLKSLFVPYFWVWILVFLVGFLLFWVLCQPLDRSTLHCSCHRVISFVGSSSWYLSLLLTMSLFWSLLVRLCDQGSIQGVPLVILNEIKSRNLLPSPMLVNGFGLDLFNYYCFLSKKVLLLYDVIANSIQ